MRGIKFSEYAAKCKDRSTIMFEPQWFRCRAYQNCICCAKNCSSFKRLPVIKKEKK